MTSAVQCSEINGETICTRKSSSCRNSFGLDCEEEKTRIVPFSQPQTNMNMRTTTTRRPFIRRTTTTRTPTTTSIATTSAPQRYV